MVFYEYYVVKSQAIRFKQAIYETSYELDWFSLRTDNHSNEDHECT